MPSTESHPPFPAYKGTEPYIFVAYAHKDSGVVFPELVQLSNWGVNIWYDEGIDPGNEWPEEIAAALAGASLLIYYVSPNSVNSRNCRDEINFGLNHNIEIVAIHIEETDIPAGLSLRIGSLQAIYKHRMTHETYLRKLKGVLEEFIPIMPGSGRGVKIAVIDTGIDVSHTELAGLKLLDDIAIENDGISTHPIEGGTDLFGNGTAIAGIIRKLAPEAELGSFRVLNEKLTSKTSTVCAGADLALDRGYNILCCCLGCAKKDHITAYKEWVDRAYRKDVHIVAAANNLDPTRQEFPSSFTTTISVAKAKTELPIVYYRRNFPIPFYARGFDLKVPWKDGSYRQVTGTSFAAAHVVGVLACLLSKSGQITAGDAQKLLKENAAPWTPDLSPEYL